MISILHITPHMGGGIGRVLSNLIDGFKAQGVYKHRVCCLEHANEKAIAWADKSGVLLADRMAGNGNKRYELVSQSDIVHVHWWNHPLIYQFMTDPLLPEMRTALWSHVNGHQAPHVFTNSLMKWPDIFVLATPYSLKAPCIAGRSEKGRASWMRIVQSCAGVDHVRPARPKPHRDFHIGYFGTVDYCKLHRRFVEMSLSVDIPNARFIVYGEDVGGVVEKDVIAAGASHKFEFCGWIEDISSAFDEFDVLGYPLDGHHYGTGEQVLIEAMAAAVVPVVLDNGIERHIVKDGKSGIVANTIEEYVAALEYLYQHPDRRTALAQQARQEALASFSIERTVDEWQTVYQDLMQNEKRHPNIQGMRDVGSKGDQALHMFLQSLGDSKAASLYSGLLNPENDQQYRKLKSRLRELRPIFQSPTRGSVYHYQSIFTDSPGLNRLCDIMRQCLESNHAGP